ncbi:MAG: PAS domain-containing sensor histidine kinase [bacterium]|nr:PAS domain-containing sensor histidine kinase [bacterium]
MNAWIHRGLLPPPAEKGYLSFSVAALHYTLLILIAVGFVAALFVTSPIQVPGIVLLLTVLVGCYGLLHSGHFRAASWIFLVGMWAVITLASFSANGLRNASIASYTLVIIFSAVLFSERVVLLFTIASVTSTSVLFIGMQNGFLPLRTTELILADRFFQNLALYLISGLLLTAAVRVLRTSFQRIALNERLLRDRNQALEREIEERERVEAQLRASEEHYRLLFENTPLFCTVYDLEGRVILINPAAAAFLGGSPADLVGKSMADLFSPQDAQQLYEQHQNALAARAPQRYEGTANTQTGRSLIYERQVIPLPPLTEHPDQPPRILAITNDITQQKQDEQRQRALEVATEKNAFLTDFLSTVSHDLKTPLSVMNTGLHLLEQATDPAYRQQKMTQIYEQVTLLDRFIQDMLMIARLEHLPALEAELTDLNPLIADVIRTLRPRIERKAQRLDYQPAPELPCINADKEQLRKAIVNLIENAIQYTPAHGSITVQTRLEAERVLLEIRDTGIGIAEADLPHIFDRFYRASEARSMENAGTGLGLAITKKVVEMHGAELQVESTVGDGTAFRLGFAPMPRPAHNN